jgi:hypothetical protein
MNRMRVSVIIGIFALGALAGCKKGKVVEGGGSNLTLFPQGGSPGMMVRVSAEKPLFARDRGAKVEIGGAGASISQTVSDAEAEVMIPNVRAGATTLNVTGEKGEGKASAPFTVLPARAQQLVLSWKDGRIELLAVHATADEPSAFATEGSAELLSFDLLNKDGALVYTGVIPHPAQQHMEVFDEPAQQKTNIRREGMAHEATFALKIPKLPEEATVRFFEAPPGGNLLDANARESRKAVGEIKVKGGE